MLQVCIPETQRLDPISEQFSAAGAPADHRLLPRLSVPGDGEPLV